MKKYLIDAGPLIALFDKDDSYHDKVKSFFKTLEGRLVTSLPVITEVLHLLDFNVNVQLDFLKWIERGALKIYPITKDHISKIIELSEKYRDMPMDFADATMIVISEIENIRDIITLDSDFYAYRNIRKEALNNILPL
ncbi:MAG: PIN domain-containing protein [Firmicutes bacterium]|nr:PIN domain-containing protein [Bacillota bacterium]